MKCGTPAFRKVVCFQKLLFACSEQTLCVYNKRLKEKAAERAAMTDFKVVPSQRALKLRKF